MSDRALFKVGCEIFVRKGDHLLLGKRTAGAGAGAGTWALPGGHLERGERLVGATCREIKEELGGDVSPANLQLLSVSDGLPTPQNDNHYLHITFELRDPSFEPRVMEPDRCAEWRYFALNELPEENLFEAHRTAIKNYLQNRLYDL